MPKQLHSYSDQAAFNRLLLLIATFVQNPGIGTPNPEAAETSHNALQAVQIALLQVAEECKIDLTPPAIPTLRKDLETLRSYGILEKRSYRWGYYLGTGIFTFKQLQILVNSLTSLADFQGDPQAKQLYQTLLKRLNLSSLDYSHIKQNQLFYPTRQHLNRAIVHTNWEEMLETGENQNNLFHHWETLTEAIENGQAIEISRRSDPYGNGNVGCIQVFPLQLIYHDIAWYLAFEYCHTEHLAIGRINRFGNYCKKLTLIRSLEEQYQNLEKVHHLLKSGWGLFLGQPEEQRLELENKLDKITVKVRFFPPVTAFIEEGKRRHCTQKIKIYKDSRTGQIQYLDYSLQLPPRSIAEFNLWVKRHFESAQVLSPPELVNEYKQSTLMLAQRYHPELQKPVT